LSAAAVDDTPARTSLPAASMAAEVRLLDATRHVVMAETVKQLL
jgi:hypothetical protein